MRNNFTEIEKRIQSFFEDQLQKLSGTDPIRIAARDVLTAQLDHIIAKNQKRYSPNIFRITFKKKLNPENLASWKVFISEIIKDEARKRNLLFSGPVHVQNFYNPLIEGEVEVESAFSSITTRKTTDILIAQDAKEAPEKKSKGYLITHLETLLPLTRKVTNIGRDENNDLVIDNLRVSRVHAQVREINGYHVLFDLDSTVGTKVNNHRISQHTLTTGDVIEIADVALIYGTDSDIDNLIQEHFHTKVIPLQERKK